MKCPGSVTLLQYLGLDESDEPDYRREGVAMHEAAAHCLTEKLDAWEIVGETFNNTVMTPELANPVQIYLDYVRSLTVTESYVEYGISSPVHPLFYGTCDFAGIYQPTLAGDRQVIHVVDLKGGEGIMVEVKGNVQLQYYAFGLIDGIEHAGGFTFADDAVVWLTICQPRGFHLDGPVRSWSTTVSEIKAWIHGVLVPAMLATEFDDSLDAGEHCRFCPAKLVCPLMTAIVGAAAKANPKHIPNLSDEQLGESYRLGAAIKFYLKAQEEEVMRRLMKARDLGGKAKLVNKKSNRVFKDGAIGLATARFGDDAWTPREVKSPAQMEKIPGAKEWVHQFSYSPDTGLTVALMDDPRKAVPVSKPTERFATHIGVDTQEDAS
jgi:hypothetical protein